MIRLLFDNAATIIVAALVILLVSCIVISLVREKKRGGSSCGCGCSGCPMSGSCHENRDKK